MKGDTIFKLMMLFLFICIIAFIVIGMAGKMEKPDNSTSPDMYMSYTATQEEIKPIMIGLNGVQIAALVILIFAGLALFVGVLKKWMHRGSGGW